MKSLFPSFKIAAISTACACMILAACTQFPSERSQISDLRPQISFKVNGAPDLTTAHVFVNDLDGGVVSNYLDGQSALKIPSGTNRIRVVLGGKAILDERVYLGDGVARAFILN